jgi:hypothetical protein
MPQSLKATRDPLALGGCLKQNLRLGPTSEELDQAIPLGPDPLVQELARFSQDRELAFTKPDVHANMFHG